MKLAVAAKEVETQPLAGSDDLPGSRRGTQAKAKGAGLVTCPRPEGGTLGSTWLAHEGQ